MLSKSKCYAGYEDDDESLLFGPGSFKLTQLLPQAFPSFPGLFVDCTKWAEIKVLAKMFKLRPSG